MAYAVGKFALGLCDRCGFEFKLKELQKEWNGLKTCQSCFEIKHPQLEPKTHTADPEAIYEARPNTDLEVNFGRVFTNKDIIGSSIIGNEVTLSLGNVTITT